MGIEPTTNSLEGCDSTTELLPLIPPGPPGKLQADSAQRSALRWKTVSLNAVKCR